MSCYPQTDKITVCPIDEAAAQQRHRYGTTHRHKQKIAGNINIMLSSFGLNPKNIVVHYEQETIRPYLELQNLHIVHYKVHCAATTGMFHLN